MWRCLSYLFLNIFGIYRWHYGSGEWTPSTHAAIGTVFTLTFTKTYPLYFCRFMPRLSPIDGIKKIELTFHPNGEQKVVSWLYFKIWAWLERQSRSTRCPRFSRQARTVGFSGLARQDRQTIQERSAGQASWYDKVGQVGMVDCMNKVGWVRKVN